MSQAKKLLWDHGACDHGNVRESAQAYGAFEAYLHQLAERGSRSVREVAKGQGKSRATREAWARRWQWVERVAAYDHDQASRRLATVEKAQELSVAEWAERLAVVDETGYLEGLDLIELGASIKRKLKDVPVVEKIANSQGSAVIVQPLNPSLVVASAKALKDGVDMCRQACLTAIFRTESHAKRLLRGGDDQPEHLDRAVDSRGAAVHWGDEPARPAGKV